MEKKPITKKWWFWTLIVILILSVLMIVTAFIVPEEWLEDNTTTEPSKISMENTSDNSASTLANEIKLEYKIADTETDNLQRRTIRVTVSESTLQSASEQDIKDFLKALTDKQIAAFNPKGLCIFLYQEGDNISGAFTVAKCEYAPNGQWGDIVAEGSTKDYSKYDYNIELADLEFQQSIRELDNSNN